MVMRQTTPAESRNIYVTGVTQQACAAGTIRSQEDLEAWTKKAAETFDTVLGPNPVVQNNGLASDKRTMAMAAFVEVIKSLSAITDLRYLYGDPTQEIGKFHDNNIALIREFANHADLYDLYTNLFRTKEGMLSI
jgi:hypothetical protein